MRTEPCVCGGFITAPTERDAPRAVAEHNASTLHRIWRTLEGIEPMDRGVDEDTLMQLQRELIPSGIRDYIDPRRHRPTASVDVSGSASAADAGGTFR